MYRRMKRYFERLKKTQRVNVNIGLIRDTQVYTRFTYSKKEVNQGYRAN